MQKKNEVAKYAFVVLKYCFCILQKPYKQNVMYGIREKKIFVPYSFNSKNLQKGAENNKSTKTFLFISLLKC